jgi:hypothetical protein
MQEPRTEPVDALVAFGRALRARGLPVGTGRILAFCRAVAILSPIEKSSLYWAGGAPPGGRPAAGGPGHHLPGPAAAID